jgi:hypothetical protein
MCTVQGIDPPPYALLPRALCCCIALHFLYIFISADSIARAALMRNSTLVAAKVDFSFRRR